VLWQPGIFQPDAAVLALLASIRFRREDPAGQQFCETDQPGSAVRRRFCNRISMVSMRSSLRSRWTS
jgi:hypothetical protein